MAPRLHAMGLDLRLRQDPAHRTAADRPYQPVVLERFGQTLVAPDGSLQAKLAGLLQAAAMT